MKISTSEIAIIISAISACISMVSVITSIYFNTKNQKQYNRSLEPALSFKLIEYKYLLYLQVTNTGKSAARDIKITVNSIENNGSREGLNLDKIFSEAFELFPGETTQGCVAIWGENMAEHTFPKLSIDVKYKKNITKKYVSFNRTVIFNPSYVEKVYADVNVDLYEINKNMRSIARANVRTANYLDGHQIGSFDELDILSGCSLHDDIMDVKMENKQSNVMSRDEVLDSIFNKANEDSEK